MNYRLEVEGAPEEVPGGTNILLLHRSTDDTDRIDIQFLLKDTDHYLVISTRTTAKEIDEKLEFFEVDRKAATIIDAISIERGYSRRESDRVEYLTGPDDIDGLVSAATTFFDSHTGKIRLSMDSISELAFYSSEDRALEAVDALCDLVVEHDAVSLFHLATEVHDESFVSRVESQFDLVLNIDEID